MECEDAETKPYQITSSVDCLGRIYSGRIRFYRIGTGQQWPDVFGGRSG
jgi:hypothetical protein